MNKCLGDDFVKRIVCFSRRYVFKSNNGLGDDCIIMCMRGDRKGALMRCFRGDRRRAPLKCFRGDRKRALLSALEAIEREHC